MSFKVAESGIRRHSEISSEVKSADSIAGNNLYSQQNDAKGKPDKNLKYPYIFEDEELSDRIRAIRNAIMQKEIEKANEMRARADAVEKEAMKKAEKIAKMIDESADRINDLQDAFDKIAGNLDKLTNEDDFPFWYHSIKYAFEENGLGMILYEEVPESMITDRQNHWGMKLIKRTIEGPLRLYIEDDETPRENLQGIQSALYGSFGEEKLIKEIMDMKFDGTTDFDKFVSSMDSKFRALRIIGSKDYSEVEIGQILAESLTGQWAYLGSIIKHKHPPPEFAEVFIQIRNTLKRHNAEMKESQNHNRLHLNNRGKVRSNFGKISSIKPKNKRYDRSKVQGDNRGHSDIYCELCRKPGHTLHICRYYKRSLTFKRSKSRDNQQENDSDSLEHSNRREVEPEDETNAFLLRHYLNDHF